MSNSGWLFLFAALGVFALFFALIGIGFYILFSIGLYKLAKNANIEYPWLSWIPVGNFYILGKLVKNVKVSQYLIPSLELILPIGFIVQYLLRNVTVIGFILQLAFYILTLIVLYKLYSMYRPQYATAWIILSIFALPVPIIIFIMRNDTPVNSGSVTH